MIVEEWLDTSVQFFLDKGSVINDPLVRKKRDLCWYMNVPYFLFLLAGLSNWQSRGQTPIQPPLYPLYLQHWPGFPCSPSTPRHLVPAPLPRGGAAQQDRAGLTVLHLWWGRLLCCTCCVLHKGGSQPAHAVCCRRAACSTCVAGRWVRVLHARQREAGCLWCRAGCLCSACGWDGMGIGGEENWATSVAEWWAGWGGGEGKSSFTVYGPWIFSPC